MKYLLIFLLVSCIQTQTPQAPTEKVYKKRFEVNKIDSKTFEIYY